MEKQKIKGMTLGLLIVALSLATGVVSANGQSTQKQHATIQFDFVVGNKSLSAGKYEVVESATHETLQITGIENNQSVFRLTSPVTQVAPCERGKLVFHKYGDQYFLAEVWIAGASSGRHLTESSKEKTLSRDLAAIPSKSEVAQTRYERIEVALAGR
jgi:hypothetical protein